MYEALPWMALVFGLFIGPTALVLLRKGTSRWFLIAVVFFLANAAFAAWFLVPWAAWSYWLYLLALAIAFVGIAAAFLKFRKADWARPRWIGAALIAGLVLGGGYLMMLNVQSIPARMAPDDTIDLASPLRGGTFAVSQGGSGLVLQPAHGRNPSQRYALDIVKLNGSLTSSRRYLAGIDFTAHEIWDEPVYSPCTGEVVWARDGIKDELERDEQQPAGNVVGIECKGATVMLAHLREGSVAVSEGESVETGQLLGRIGMSGRTFLPHLHMHVERGSLKRDFSNNESVGFTLDGRFPYKGLIMTMGE